MLRQILIVLFVCLAFVAVKSATNDPTIETQPLIADDTEPTLALPTTEPIKDTNQSFRYKWIPAGSYLFEATALTALAIFFINLSVGRSTNQTIATRVFESLVNRLNDQFAVIGSYGQSIPSDCLKPLPLTNQSNANQSIQFYKGSLNEFSLSFTGRNGVDMMVVSLDTVKRHDLISLTLSKFDLSQKTDHLMIDCLIERMPPLVFAVVRKKYEKRMRKNVRDLELYTHSMNQTIKQTKFPPSLSVMCDNDEAVDQLIDSSFAKLLSDFDRWIILLHVSDQAVPMPGTTNTKILSFKLELPNPLDEVALQSINQLIIGVLGLVDRLNSYQMSPSAIAKAQDMRRKAAQAEAKKDEKKKEQPIKKEKENKKPKMKVKAMRG